MKRLFTIIFALLLLTACGKPEEVPAVTEEEPEVIVTEEVTATEPTVVIEPEIVVPEIAEETVQADGSGQPVTYTATMVEGLVEDTIGYSFEIPIFDYPCAETIRRHYDQLAVSMEAFTKEVVYANAMERTCIASVYGYVTSATVVDDVLSVTYVFECDYSDTEEATEESRIDRFDLTTGQLLEG